MRLGKLFVGWRSLTPEEAQAFDLTHESDWLGLMIEWGTANESWGVLLMTKERARAR